MCPNNRDTIGNKVILRENISRKNFIYIYILHLQLTLLSQPTNYNMYNMIMWVSCARG